MNVEPRRAIVANLSSNLARLAVFGASLYFIVHASRFFTFAPKVLGKYLPLKWAIFLHVAGGMIALVAGPLALSKRLRLARPRVHRVLGRVFVGAIVAGGGSALVLALRTAPTVGFAYAASLVVLATVWVGAALAAIVTAMKKRFDLHERWATRSYLATVAFVAQSLLFEAPFVARLGPYPETTATVIWLSWTVPMIAYELATGAKGAARRARVASARGDGAAFGER